MPSSSTTILGVVSYGDRIFINEIGSCQTDVAETLRRVEWHEKMRMVENE